MTIAIKEELEGSYSFYFGSIDKLIPIELIKSRRRNDLEGCYVPYGDLKKPEIKKLWQQYDFSQCQISKDYLNNCLSEYYTPRKALEGFHPRAPFLKNTVFIHLRKSEADDVEIYGVFLITHMDNKPLLVELYRVCVRNTARMVQRSDISDLNGEEGGEVLLYQGYSFGRYTEGCLDYFTHKLNYRSEKTNKEYISLLITNIVIGSRK